jgi:hypothetical protein
MPIEHIIQPGDCLTSIAAKYGFRRDTIWQSAENQQLRSIRSDPSLLAPGDKVVIPDLRPLECDAATGQRHQFKCLIEPAYVCLRLLDAQLKPRANLAYTLHFQGKTRSGNTDGNGVIKEKIPPHLESAILVIEGDEPESYDVKLGWLDPLETPASAAQRLANLGAVKEVTADPQDPQTAFAADLFCRRNGSQPNLQRGLRDSELHQALQEHHKS